MRQPNCAEASPNRLAMFAPIVFAPVWRMCGEMVNEALRMMASEIDSPMARPRASIDPPTMPPRPKGSTTIRIMRQRLPPRASAASFSPGGVWENTSRMIDVAVGRIISEIRTPPMNIDPG